MATADGADPLGNGAWAVFVARAVRKERDDHGEAAANRLAVTLRGFKHEAIDAASGELRAMDERLLATAAEVAEARRAHERLQADIARMTADVREAKIEAAAVRAEAAEYAAARRAEVAAEAEAESRRIAAAWDEVRAKERDLAARRSALLDDVDTTPPPPGESDGAVEPGGAGRAAPQGSNVAGWGRRPRR